jgi:small-conductance mechanosensitive channel
VEKQKGKKIKSIKLKSLNLMDEERATKLILSVIKIMRYIVIGIMLYIAITLIFSVFPPTRGIADKLLGYILFPVQKIFMSIVRYIPNLITLIIIIFVFRYLIRGLRYLAEEIDKGRLTIKGFYPDWAHPTFSIIKTLLYAFMFIVIFPYLPGSDSEVFKGVSIFIGVVFSLGSSSIINNVMSGLVLTYMRPFKVGDRIKIGDIVGNVVEKTPFVTRIRTPKNEEVTIPNSGIMSAQTFNYTHSAQVHKLILHTEVSFGYDVPWRQAHQLLLEAAARTSQVLKEPKPFVFQTALDDFYVVYQINIYIQDADKMAIIYSELNQNILDVFNEAGVEIMSPSYTAHRDGNQIAIPTEYLPNDYQVPSFNVKVKDR